MLEQALDHGRRHGGDIGADLGRFEDVDRVADRGDEDFGREIVIVVDQANIADQRHSVEAVVVVATDEGRDEARPRLGREQRLVGRKA